MTIELPEQLESVLKVHANARGISPDLYVREILERDLASTQQPEPVKPLKSGRGLWAKYGISLSAEDIDENRAEMFKNFGEDF
jgi:plasmid stability protein